jgi:uncharacterized protein
MAVDVVGALIPGIIIGILIGFILQRGRFCFNSAIRDPLLMKDYKLIKGVFVAISVEMIGFAIMILTDPESTVLGSRQLFALPQIVGGTIFGMGMVLASGCASGTTYRVGEGMMGSLVALIGLTLGVYLVKPGGILNPAMGSMLEVTPKSVSNIGGDSAPIIMLVLGIVGLVLLVIRVILPAIKEKKEKKEQIIDTSKLGEIIFKNPWKWWVSGIALGIMAIIWLAVSGSLLGITGHWWNVGNSLIISSDLSMGGCMVIGIIVGAMIAAKIAGELKLRAPDGKTILTQLIGGVMMGVGAAFAGGCNIGNMLSGVAILSVGSIIVTIFIALGCWLMTYLLFMRE